MRHGEDSTLTYLLTTDCATHVGITKQRKGRTGLGDGSTGFTEHLRHTRGDARDKARHRAGECRSQKSTFGQAAETFRHNSFKNTDSDGIGSGGWDTCPWLVAAVVQNLWMWTRPGLVRCLSSTKNILRRAHLAAARRLRSETGHKWRLAARPFTLETLDRSGTNVICLLAPDWQKKNLPSL